MKKDKKCEVHFVLDVHKTLVTIGENFWWAAQSMTRWTNASMAYHKYVIRAEALLELIEVEDCGAAGGYGNEGTQGIYPNSLFHRWLWLMKKYNPKGLKAWDKNAMKFLRESVYLGDKNPR
jgi:hypothetical protein